MTKIGYKVLNSDLTSITRNVLKKRAIQYKVNEWVSSWPGTPLMYFDNLDDAKTFIAKERHLVWNYAWKRVVYFGACIYKVETRYPFKGSYSMNFDSLEDVIAAALKHKKLHVCDIGFPKNTRFCKQIKLIEKVM